MLYYIQNHAGLPAVMTALVQHLSEQDLRVCGTEEVPTDTPLHCGMDIRILPDGPVLRISQELGTGARGCRLDAGALEAAVAACEVVYAKGADILILNKFGKLEGQGRGFAPLIAKAIEDEVPVVLGVNGLNLEAFLNFAGDLAVELLPPGQLAALVTMNRRGAPVLTPADRKSCVDGRAPALTR